MTIDDLEQLIITAELEIARIRAAQVAAIRLLDGAQVATTDGSRTLTDWVAAKLDIGHDTATPLVTAARTMPDTLADELSRGDITFDRATAETRLHRHGATPHMIEGSRRFDIAGVRRLAARHRRITPRDEQTAFASQYVTIQPSLDGNTWNLWASLDSFDGRLVEKALHQRADEITDPGDHHMPTRLRMAFALTTICQDSLYQPLTEGSRPQPTVTVMADATLTTATRGHAGAEIVGGPRIGPTSLEELICIGTVEVNLVGADGAMVGLKPSRSIPPRLRRAVLARDGACTIDGCASRYRLEAHHIHEKAKLGSDDPTNLTTLCWTHHHIYIHRRGFTLDPHSPPARRKLRPPRSAHPPH